MSFFSARMLKFYHSIRSKIAFYPSLFALAGLLFALIMMYLEKLGISEYLVEHAPLLVVNSGDTALAILSACITGLISIMVFSFSMVMVLLNQAASAYSPRLLPGLISDRRHQIILGIYISSILYCIFILFSIQPTGDQYQIPGFSVLLGIIITVISIYAFIYFIHNISETIQITNILQKIFLDASKRLSFLLEQDQSMPLNFPDTHGWFEYRSDRSGYFQDFSGKDLLLFCKKNHTFLEVIPIKGIFVLKGSIVFRSKEKLNDQALQNLFSNFHLSRKELVTANYVLAFKQITEVILKAMSPGVNDPGTALNSIDYLSELIRLRMMKSDQYFISDSGQDYVKMKAVTFEELLYQINAPLRKYCSGDIVVVQKLGYMFLSLKIQKALYPSYHGVLEKEAKSLLLDARVALSNESDLITVDTLAKKLHLEL